MFLLFFILLFLFSLFLFSNQILLSSIFGICTIIVFFHALLKWSYKKAKAGKKSISSFADEQYKYLEKSPGSLPREAISQVVKNISTQTNEIATINLRHNSGHTKKELYELVIDKPKNLIEFFKSLFT